MAAQLGGEVDRSRPAEQPMTRLPRQAITLGPTPAAGLTDLAGRFECC
jgi:hypothetical protein